MGGRGAVTSLLLFLLAAYGALALFALVAADRLIFQPPPPSYGAADLPIVRVPAGAGEWIALLHLPDPDAEFTILFSHGNAEDLGHILPVLRAIHAAGFAVVAYDYRGYGRSAPARPGVRHAVADLDAAFRHTTGELGVAPGRVLLHGRSVGSGPTLDLAARERVGGVVLESAFTSAYRVVTRIPLLPGDRFPNLHHVRNLAVPLLVVHGTEDGVIPVAHGRQLFAAAGEPKQVLWVEGAGHNDLAYVAGSRYGRALREFAAFAGRHGHGAPR